MNIRWTSNEHQNASLTMEIYGNSEVMWWKPWETTSTMPGSQALMEWWRALVKVHRKNTDESDVNSESNENLNSKHPKSSKIIQFFIQNHLTESNIQSYKGLKRFGSKVLSSLRSCTWDQTAVFNAVFNRRWRSAQPPVEKCTEHGSNPSWIMMKCFKGDLNIKQHCLNLTESLVPKKDNFGGLDQQMTQFPWKTNPSP